MKEKRKTPEEEIQQFLEETKAENDALKKLLAALHEEELRWKSEKSMSDESSKNITI